MEYFYYSQICNSKNQYLYTMIKNEFSIFETELNVRPDDIDMFNHVHNSKYLDYVLAARYEQMDKHYSMSWEKFSEMGYGWVVAQVIINFKRPLKMGDSMIVRTGILEMNEKGSKVQFQIINKKTNKISSDGIFDYVMIDLKTQRSCKVTPEMIAAYSI